MFGGEMTDGVNPITSEYISDLHTTTSVSGFLDHDQNSISDFLLHYALFGLVPWFLIPKIAHSLLSDL